MPDEFEPIPQKILEGFEFSADIYSFTDDDYARMAKALGLKGLDTDQKAVLQWEGIRYAYLSQSWSKAPRPQQIRKMLEEIREEVRHLMEFIHGLHFGNEKDLAAKEVARVLMHAKVPDNKWATVETDFFEFSESLCKFGAAAKWAQEELGDDNVGRSLDYPLRVVISCLAKFYTDVTGKQPTVSSSEHSSYKYGGSFFDFIEIFISPMPGYIKKSNETLGRTLQRFLKELRASSRDKTPS